MGESCLNGIVTWVENRFPRRGSYRVKKNDGRWYIVTIARVKDRRGEEAFVRIVKLSDETRRSILRQMGEEKSCIILGIGDLSRRIEISRHMHTSVVDILLFPWKFRYFSRDGKSSLAPWWHDQLSKFFRMKSHCKRAKILSFLFKKFFQYTLSEWDFTLLEWDSLRKNLERI